jgi:hypothetical protein
MAKDLELLYRMDVNNGMASRQRCRCLLNGHTYSDHHPREQQRLCIPVVAWQSVGYLQHRFHRGCQHLTHPLHSKSPNGFLRASHPRILCRHGTDMHKRAKGKRCASLH